MKPTSIQTEIISLLHSPELQAYLLASPELLQTTDYAELIAGAPIGLSKKLELLEKLEESLADSEDAELVHIYVECVEDAMEPLEETYEQLFCAQFYAASVPSGMLRNDSCPSGPWAFFRIVMECSSRVCRFSG